MDNFDPLMGAHNAILSNAMGIVGLALMMPNADGSDRCPLCFLNADSRETWDRAAANGVKPGDPCCTDPRCTDKVTFPDAPRSYDEWVDRAADEMVTAWKAMRP